MRLLRAIAIASVAEVAGAGAACGLCAVAGRWSGWFDLFAQLAPIWLALSAVGGVLAWPVVGPGLDRWVVLAIAAVGVLTNGALMAPEFAAAPISTPPASAAKPLKVLTFNVWDDDVDPDAAVAAILAANADVVALQEVNGLGEAQRDRLAKAYPYSDSCYPNPCDIMLLSKAAWTRREDRVAPDGGGLVAVWGQTTAPDGEPVTVATTHLAWPIPPGPQAAQRKALAQLIKALPPTHLILTGDFNLTPWSAALQRQDRDLAPLVRRTRAVFTWPAMIAPARKPAPFPLAPIDQIYAGPAWRTAGIRRLPRAGSDHYGVLATFLRTQPG